MPRQRRLCNCSVTNCFNTSLTNPELSFFSIPQDGRRKLWLYAIERHDLLTVPTTSRHRRVCEEHFTRDSILYTNNRKVLKKTAIPSRFLPSQEISDEVDSTTGLSTLIAAANLTQTDDDVEAALMRDTEETIAYPYRDQASLIHNYTFEMLCDRYLTKDLAIVIKANKDLIYKSQEDNHEDFRNFCFSLYEASPKAYHLFQDVFVLPTSTSLIKQCIKFNTEVNDKIMMTLKTRVDKMTVKEKNCSVLLGSMRLKANLCYNIKKDNILGFQEINGVKYLEPTTKVLVVMIRGIFSNWKQPIGYALVTEKGYEDKIDYWLNDLLRSLFAIGLKVRTFISNMEDGLKNLAKKESLLFSPSSSVENPYFLIDDNKIYHIFDAPDLINSIRDTMFLNDFHFDGQIAKYEYIVNFYNEDQTKRFPLANKLTKKHICQTDKKARQEVKYAAQLLSKTVANGLWNYINFNLIQEAGKGTVEFVTIINNLFDTLNASKLINCENEYKEAFCGKETQKAFFEEIIVMFQNFKVFNTETTQDVTSTVKFIQAFPITLKSILLLFDDLKKEGHRFLLTRALQLEPLEKIFKVMKSRNDKSARLTGMKFESELKKIFFSYHRRCTLEGNCNGEFRKFMVQTDVFDNVVNETKMEEHITTIKDDNEMAGHIVEHEIKVLRSDYNQINTPERHSLFYICGFLLFKVKEKHTNCPAFKNYLQSYKTDKSKYQRYNKQSRYTEESLLAVPCDTFVMFVDKMEKKFHEAFENVDIINNRIVTTIFNEIKEIPYTHLPCFCFPTLYLIKLFLRIKIFYTIRFNNREFRKNKNLTYFIIPKIDANTITPALGFPVLQMETDRQM